MPDDPLSRFSPATQVWFRGAFAAPTPAQSGAWDAISAGQHTLVVAPTGSGKTLAAFLWALDRLASTPAPEQLSHRCRVLYVSPLKALAVDVERNLRTPLTGLHQAARRLSLPVPEVSVAVRSGDTPTAQRRAFVKNPPDILITTPESLFLLLTSRARDALQGVETVILDEVHAVAGTKRGAHLALSLARLDARLSTPAQRIGLSATVRPVEEVSRFLAGGRPVSIVQPESTKRWDIQVVVPVPDMGELGQVTDDLSGPAAGSVQRTSIWPHVENRITDLVAEQRATLVFANSRRLAERLTARLNEIWHEQHEQVEPLTAEDSSFSNHDVGSDQPGIEDPAAPPDGRRPPSEVAGQSGTTHGAPPLLARAHHGSVSREQRIDIEEDLKAGRLPAVVATSSLELGIDMGAIDLVVQVESPPSVASGLQRVGRAGHHVDAISRGVIFPKYRGDLVQTAVVVERMRTGQIEHLAVPSNPLDVLAQHIVAMCALDEWTVPNLHALLRRSAPFAELSRPVLDSVLDMLSGLYPSEDFASLRPRITWDRVTDTLNGRPGALHLAVTSGGTIPDRGLYGVFLAGSGGPGRRVGELDEEMVYESRVGDVFTLGTTSWRIEEITHDQVLVTPAPGVPGRLPFWKGDAPGRPSELGAAIGSFVRQVGSLSPEQAVDRVRSSGLDKWATENLLAYLSEQREATGHVPHDRTIVVEQFRDEIGDWRIVVHSPYGAPVHAPWALCIAALMRERFGLDVQAMHADDGIVLRLPDTGQAWNASESGPQPTTASLPELIDLIMLDPEAVAEMVTEQIGGSALFASRFRECAARALLLPRRRPDRRQALWQQRQRAAQLLEVASRFPSFPIVLEAVRECVRDVFDVPGLVDLMRRIRARQVNVVSVQTPRPSPFARALLFGYVEQFLYEGDSPLAERRAAALSLDPALLAELLGGGEGPFLRDLLDPAAVHRTEADLQRLTPERQARSKEELVDTVRALGPLGSAELAERCAVQVRDQLGSWLVALQQERRLIEVRLDGTVRWAVVEDAARLRDALGVALPQGLPDALLRPTSDPLADLAIRFARNRGPFAAVDLADWLCLGHAVAVEVLRRLVATGRLIEGELRPLQATRAPQDDNHAGPIPALPVGLDYCDAEVLRTLRRRSLAALRSEVEPVTAADLVRFLPPWQGLGGSWRGIEGLSRAVELLCGALLPASALETLILPARVRDYTPALLDELLATGEVTWQGHGLRPTADGWISLHPTDTAPLTLAVPQAPSESAGQRVLDVLSGGGGFFFRALYDALGSTDEQDLERILWDLVAAGRITNDSLAPLRAGLTPHRSASRSRSARRGSRYGGRGLGSLGRRPASLARLELPNRLGPPTTAGRWSVLPQVDPDLTVRGYATAELLLDRYGVLTRGTVDMEGIPGGFAGIYRILAAAEDVGKVRRGYFVEGLGAAQFASAGAVDRLRAHRRLTPPHHEPSGSPAEFGSRSGIDGSAAVVLSACDPANPFGAALAWPERSHEVGVPGHTSTSFGSQTVAGSGRGTPATNAVDQPGPESEPAHSRPAPQARPGHRPGRKAGAVVVIHDGELILYVERGGRTLLSFSESPAALDAAASALASAVHRGALGRLTVERVDGDAVLRSAHPVAAALDRAGFHATPRGLRLRR